ncbi:MAG TPA: mannose-1-phosphate guanylyltransferase/mannose-6-phosphate isomerase [Mesorhizobium sp.]|jgi:mannose-1-phosphate guanylyltransferase/mannose-1-phosphate guanylyltransferase/mannose-6-phosphate isomerase|nr:mannose-1-phosphate guanylyltransferase/mannose-6-phosphate isomerase [Mesorhizobium sp.]
MPAASRRITPVLLSGGSGSRLWPLSRKAYPKQFLSLGDEQSLIQQAALRTSDAGLFEPLIVIANQEHRFLVAEQMRRLDAPVAEIVLEPVGRNTTAAATVAALLASERDPQALILVMPADHVIGDAPAFLDAVRTGAEAAADGDFVLFGVKPTAPATSYGYLRLGAPHASVAGVFRVDRFVEKPDLATAGAYLQSGEYAWNSGIFLLSARVFLEEVERLRPDILDACREARAHARRDLDFLRLDPERFAACPSVSIDYAVMEHTARAVAVPAAFPWTDVGSWLALWEIAPKDESGNAHRGDAVFERSRGSYAWTDGPLIAVLGLDDVIVAASGDSVLVASKAHDQDVKGLVERLKRDGHGAATQTVQVHRPWGFYQSVHSGERFQVKRLTVNPGAKLSLQKHFHRAEHWVVVNGTALVTRDGEEIILRENESIFLPLGCTHRLENPGRLPLNLIEVQSGSYLGEDDIVRFEDDYARS